MRFVKWFQGAGYVDLNHVQEIGMSVDALRAFYEIRAYSSVSAAEGGTLLARVHVENPEDGEIFRAAIEHVVDRIVDAWENGYTYPSDVQASLEKAIERIRIERIRKENY